MNYVLTYCFYVLILSVLMGISTWKLFKKMGYNPVFAFIPFYNYSIVLKETEHPKWWVILSYLPIVGPIMMSVFHLFLMKKFGKVSFAQRVLTVVLPFVYMAVVNYSKDTEIYKEFLLQGEEEAKKKDGFWGSVVYAVVFATVIHTFITQPFGVPTGSMERTILVGDFLFVNKLNYGYRFPMRPVAIPFLQGTIGGSANPKKATKSYVDGVKLPYFRLPGWEKVERNDIVVFNYPGDSAHVAIDRKDPYVKRVVGIPGDVIEMRNGRLFVNNQPEKIMGDAEVQHSYLVYTSSALDINRLWKVYGYLPLQEGEMPTGGYVYQFQGLTDKTAAEIKSLPEVTKMEEVINPKGEAAISYYNQQTKAKIDTAQSIFPINKPWNADQYGPLKIPKKGDVVAVNKDNLPEYQWIIHKYEGHKLENKNGKIFIDGKESNQYTIEQDYYFMMGDNRDASLDARFFGFVPEQYIVGKPMFTWLSVQGVFDEGPKKVRWDRMFKASNTGDINKTSYWWIAVLILVLFFGWDYFTKMFKKKKEDE
ncbi:S26 family signal peptidase [Elizabethkingia anophelis]|uniref:signal peptidase I n=1 Tax=Elizabethkingia TaxID=308865 RepID=UPI00162554AF|nr:MULTISPECIES: signal peptidase I [Elizabethkingia]MCT3671620.1 signal peptidase I [Elizabethkingia anophelis]MCT3679410.1 signal peptidase I [Elizabethkingia anophelis]MCT3703028.1 signal peptidase I [Elizabethkingia anophelis]MCT3769285.1 signal peptidase I [Elizabethkingia anophelis]MCT3779541.1 signal peptidase I [Elizabethkingia anophelis]